MNPQYKTALLLMLGMIACLGLTAFVYWDGLAGNFMLDDGANIVVAYISNPHLDAIVHTVTHNGSGLLGRSVSILSFVLTGLQYGLDPWGYKYHNLILHLLNGVLLFRLLYILLPLLDQQLNRNRALLVAGSTTALWLLHPLLVSTVLYAVQRMTQLVALFTLLALLAYVKARLSTESSWRYYLCGWLLFPVCAILAVLSKENGALIPFYVLALELLVFRTKIADCVANWRIGLPYLIFGLLPLLLGAAIFLLNFDAFTDYNGRTFTLEERLLTQIHVLFFYVRLILLPRIREMSLFHDDYPVVTSLDMMTFMLLLVILLACAAIFLLRKSWTVMAFGIAWFLISHLLESTVVPLEMVFEHRNYLAAVGLLLPVVHGIFRVDVLKPLRLTTPVFVLVLAFMTDTRASEWGRHELFSMMAVTEHPGSGRAQNGYVNLLSSRREYDKAIEQLEKMSHTRMEPGVRLHMLLLKCGMGTRDEQTLAEVEQLFGESPVSVYALNALQSLVNNVVQGKCTLFTVDEMESLIQSALDYPKNQQYEHNLANLQRLMGIVAFAKGYYAQGYAFFMMAHEKTGETALLSELLNIQLDLRQLDDAEDTLELMKKENSEHFGIDSYLVNLATQRLDRVRELENRVEE